MILAIHVSDANDANDANDASVESVKIHVVIESLNPTAHISFGLTHALNVNRPSYKKRRTVMIRGSIRN